MFGINLKYSLATASIAAAILVPTASASAGAHQSSVTDGTSNTILFGAHAGAGHTPNIDLAGPFVPNN